MLYPFGDLPKFLAKLGFTIVNSFREVDKYMFFERVPITASIGITAGQIFQEYGIEPAQLGAIIALPQNDELRRSVSAPIGISTPLPLTSSICLPIDHSVTVALAEKRVDMANGLRPLPMTAGVVDRSHVRDFTHGVEIWLDRTGLACNRMRWLQTITKRNNPDRSQPLEFVDIGSNGFPWYNDSSRPDPVRFDDLPCGPEATPGHPGIRFTATVSLSVWTMDRITIVKGFTYGFNIGHGHTLAAVHWNPRIRVATDAEITNQIRILEAGINQFRQSTGGSLIYNPIPADNSVNEGILFGRF